MSAADTTIELLRSIDASLKQLVKQSAGAASKPIASNRDLDGKYGDPVVKFMPRDWTGPSFKGRTMSECPPELLDLLAETFDYFAVQAEAKDERTDRGKPVAEFKRADAARARGWAHRMRTGRHHAPQTSGPADAADAGFSESFGDGGWSSGPDRW